MRAKSKTKGPDMMNNLVGILCRFRKKPIAFIGDMERMYHRFHVYPSNRDFLRFLWFKEGNLTMNPLPIGCKFISLEPCHPQHALILS